MQSHRFEKHPYRPPTDESLSVFTIHGHVRTQRAFFHWLAKEGFTETNIAREIKPPKLVQKVISPLSDQEISSILHAFNASNSIHFRDQVIFMLLLDTGLRMGELLNLRMKDVQLDQGLLKVLGKGKKERVVPMGNKSQKVLQRYLFQHRPEPSCSGIDNVFLTAQGIPLTENCVRLMFGRLALRSGVQRLHAHLCRHTFATRFLINGGDIFTLQLILGHSTLEMVRHYVNLASTHVAMKHHEYSPLDRIGLHKI
jgi:integrase/recombinase XerC/integrase/recombinase XerD